jgi:hypothetical protein
VSQPAERWDVVVEILSGPLSEVGQQVLRGPVVRVGLDPGPGGLQLAGYRGLEARHAVITAYDGASVTIAPVGTTHVRLAPHPHVNWDEIEPIRGPQHLNTGGAIHLGPVGRGATLRFVRCQPLGAWEQGKLASEIPGAQEARKTRTIVPGGAEAWFLGCLLLMTTATVAVLGSLGIAWFLNKKPDVLVTEEGEYWKDYTAVDRYELEEYDLFDDLEAPFEAFVMRDNAEASERPGLDQPANWDREFYDRVVASAYQHAHYRRFYRRLAEVKDEYATVVTALREAELPDVFAGIPYRESTYRADVQSDVCAKGWWQFMPEVAYRMEKHHAQDFVVRDCHFSDAPDVLWSPTELTPPRNVRKNAKYVSASGKCRITHCDVDDRTDLQKSTEAAIVTLKEAWHDETLRESGALVQLVIASHNAGYDDSRFGVEKATNVKPAYEEWAKTVDSRDTHLFYGRNITCSEKDEGTCGGVLPVETQHYVYPIVARHLLAVCYYAKNHPEEPAFQRWTEHLDGYCTRFDIPDLAYLR